jgi:hypothetical protein
LVHSTGAAPSGAAEETVRVATTVVSAAAASTVHQEHEGIGHRTRVGMALL